MIRRSTFKGLSFRLYGLTALFGLGLMAIGVSALWAQWQADRASRISQLAAMTQTITKLMDTHRAHVASGEMTEDAAKARVFAEIVAMTFNNDDYFTVEDTTTGKIAAHPNPKLVGTDVMTREDANGFKYFADVIPRAIRDGFASVDFVFPRLGSDIPAPKIGVYRYYAPWKLVVGTGTYVDDLKAQFWRNALFLGLLALTILVTLVGAAALIVRSVVRPIGDIGRAMTGLAAGDTDINLPDGGAVTETRTMAAAVRVFKDAAIERERMAAAADAARRAADATQRQHAAQVATSMQQQVAVVEGLAAGLDRMSSGDLTVRLETAFAPEYERLRKDFNRTVAQLEKTIGTMVGITDAIRNGSGQITAAADDLSRRTEQQAASLEETAAALDEITATVRKTAEAATNAKKLVGASQAGAEQSSRVVQDAVAAMQTIEGSAKEITQIIGVIDEIAFQTNLLALNAGVEAARAGDSGRGFAVVASEVRALAQRSAEAAKEIKALISTSSQQVSRGVELVGETGRSLKQIIAEVGEISIVVNDIAASAQEQATGLHQVNTAVNQMDQVTQQNAAMVEQSTAASHSLVQETTELNRLTAFFQTEAVPTSSVATDHRQDQPARSGEPVRPAAKAVPAQTTSRTGGRSNRARSAAGATGWEEF
jgi:methyl-accepting chemotaxis protein